MDDNNSNNQPIDGENISNEEMINFSELDELGLGAMEYYEDGQFGTNMENEDISYEFLDCDMNTQQIDAQQESYQHVSGDAENLPLQAETQQIVGNQVQEQIIPIHSQSHEEQIFQSNQFQSSDPNVYQTIAPTTQKVEQSLPEQNAQPVYEFSSQQVQVPVQTPETVLSPNIVSVPIVQKLSQPSNVISVENTSNINATQTSTVQIVTSTPASVSQTVQQPHPVIANTVKYVPFQPSSSAQSGLMLQKPTIVSGTGQTLLIQDNTASQPRYFVQTAQGPVIFSGTPSTASVQGSTQTVLVSTSQPDSSKLISPVLTTINPNIVQNIPKTVVQDNSQTPKPSTNLMTKPFFLLAPTAVKPGSVPASVMTFSQQTRMPSVAIRPKLQKIAPSPSKDQVLNKGSIQIGIQNNNKNVQFMVLDSGSESSSSTATPTIPKLSPSNIQGVSKVIKTTKSPVNLVQLVTPNNNKKMFVNLTPNTKYGTVVQPVSKPGLPPASTRVLVTCPRPRTFISNSSPTTTASNIIGTGAARGQNFRTISGTEANISSSKMFSQAGVRSPSTIGNIFSRNFNPASDDQRRKACNCNRSQCLKLYCECFANGEFCQNCNCSNCCNNLDHEEMRQKAIRFCLERNPNAFHPKIGQKSADVTHKKGCNCKKSGCLKNYCECYEAKILCTDKCKCTGCKNSENNNERRLPPISQVGMTVSDAKAQKCETETVVQDCLPVWEPNSDVKLPFKVSPDMNPFNLLTDEVLDATACCMIAQREEAENEGQDKESIERLTLEMFGDCLNQMFNLDGNKMNKNEGEVKFLQAKK